jgi:hypothetical protein
MNGCAYIFTIRKGEPQTKDNTVHLECPEGKLIETIVDDPFGPCNITIKAQTPAGGIVYEAGGAGQTHYITGNITVSGIHVVYDGGFVACGVAKGKTTETSTLTGKITIKGFNTEGEQVGITATGSPPPPTFRSEAAHTQYTGSQVVTNEYKFGELVGSVSCSTVTVDGTTSATSSSEVTLKPAYSGCEGLKKTVTTHMNGCAYILKPTSEGTGDGPVTIECPKEQKVETTYDKFEGGCTITFGAQTPSGVVDYKGEGSGSSRDLLLTWTLEGIKYTRDGCEIGGEGSNGKLSGTVTLTGEDTSGNQKGIWIE